MVSQTQLPLIRKADEADASLLSTLASQTFWESHGRSAPEKDIRAYVAAHYSAAAMKKELENPGYHYHFILAADIPVGFSKIIFDQPHPGVSLAPVSKLERIYVLKNYYGLKLGARLFEFNKELSKSNQDKGMWLYVWKENLRAFEFYRSRGFRVVGSHDFKISETHSNPNHLMLLEF